MARLDEEMTRLRLDARLLWRQARVLSRAAAGADGDGFGGRGMTKDALIEVLAALRWENIYPSVPWERAPPDFQDAYRRRVAKDVDCVVAFFRHWLVERCQRTSVSFWLVHRWDQDMGT
jgi:hypothetical protein